MNFTYKDYAVQQIRRDYYCLGKQGIPICYLQALVDCKAYIDMITN